MAEYEFTAAENQSIDQLRTKLSSISIMLVVAGALLVFFALGGETSQAIWYSAIPAIAFIVLGYVYYRPVENLKRVTSTHGQDIMIMMMAMNDLRIAFTISQVIFVVLIVMAIVQISRMLGF
ncbi:MAG TPA: hypothetical protein VIS55_00790 [Pseudomonadales bacterium]